ncbi:MAG: TetR/AcrR family transcriptional regulator [Actinomycetota bacterium]|nr:TetR/AcrR family transcriptional regulator [Actinomycetota bacterium]
MTRATADGAPLAGVPAGPAEWTRGTERSTSGDRGAGLDERRSRSARLPAASPAGVSTAPAGVSAAPAGDPPAWWDGDEVAALVARLPARPPVSMDRLLDATAACLLRHGMTRTTMTDVARQMQVARSTLYRQVRSVREAAWWLAVREAYRGLDAMASAVDAEQSAEALVDAMAAFVRFAAAHPVVSRMLRDEPDLVGRVVGVTLPAVVSHATRILAPLFARAMEAGAVRQGDPVLVAEWVCRTSLTLIAVPSEHDPAELLREMLAPVVVP